jgi:ATP-dependent Clp protease, protease subunit
VNITQTEQDLERVLFLNGAIAEESWFEDDVTPKIFKEELFAENGDITVWINSPGGDCVAAAQIYNMLIEYPGNVTVKIDGVAASAASVIAMAGTKVYMSPVSMLMIHNPMTMAYGNTAEMQKAIDMLSEVKESIINAYEVKTGLSRAKLSRLMDAETWMNVNKAVELGFADGVLNKVNDDSNALLEQPSLATSFSRVEVTNSLMNKIADKCRIEKKSVTKQEEPILTERSVDSLMDRLKLIKNHI